MQHAGDMSSKIDEVRRQAAMQHQEMQEVMSAAMHKAASSEANLKNEVQYLKDKLTEAYQSQGEAAEQLRAAEKLKSDLQYSQALQADTANRLAAVQFENENVKAEHGALAQKCESQKHELVLRDQDLSRKGHELQNVHAQMAELDKRLAEAMLVKGQTEQQLLNAKDGNTNLADRVSVLTGQLHLRGQETSDLRQQFVQKEKDLLEAQLITQRLQADIAMKDTALSQLAEERGHMDEHIKSTMAEISKMRGEKDHFLTQALNDKNMLQDLEGEIQMLNQKIDGLQATNQRLFAEVASKDESLAKMVETRSGLGNKVTQLEADVEDRDRELQVAHSRILSVEARLRDADAKVRDAEGAADAKIATLGTQITVLTSKMNSTTDEVIQKNEIITSLENKLRDSSQEVSGLKGQVKSLQDHCADLNTQIQNTSHLSQQQLADSTAFFQQQLADLNNHLKTSQQQLDHTKNVNTQLEAQVDNLQEQVASNAGAEQLWHRAVEQNRAQNIILEELRYKVSEQDRLLQAKDAEVKELEELRYHAKAHAVGEIEDLRYQLSEQDRLLHAKEAQVKELISQRDDATRTLLDQRGASQDREQHIRELASTASDLQQQLASAVTVGQNHHKSYLNLQQRAVRVKELVLKRIIAVWMYECVSEAFYGWSSLVPSQTDMMGSQRRVVSPAIQHTQNPTATRTATPPVQSSAPTPSSLPYLPPVSRCPQFL